MIPSQHNKLEKDGFEIHMAGSENTFKDTGNTQYQAAVLCPCWWPGSGSYSEKLHPSGSCGSNNFSLKDWFCQLSSKFWTLLIFFFY